MHSINSLLPLISKFVRLSPVGVDSWTDFHLKSQRQTCGRVEKGVLICMHQHIFYFHNETYRSDCSMSVLSFQPCQEFCGGFTAECTHCSFPSSTIKEHLMEGYMPNTKCITDDSMAFLSCGKLFKRVERLAVSSMTHHVIHCFQLASNERVDTFTTASSQQQ